MPDSDKVITFQSYFIQPNWYDAFKSNAEQNIWISSKKINSDKSNNYNLKVLNKSIKLEPPNDDLGLITSTEKCIVVQDKIFNVSHRFLSELQTFSSIHNKSINSLDVAPNSIAVSSSTDGSLLVWDTANGIIKHDLKGHLMEVNKCRFFPSSEVILSAGSDMQIKIWSAIDGQCPVTLMGHKAGVNDVAIVDRGRNIISVGRDGLVKLWNCGMKCCIEDLFDIQKEEEVCPKPSINCCAIRSIDDFNLGQRSDERSLNAVGTENKLLLVGAESGSIYGLGVDSKQTVFNIKCESAVNCIIYNNLYNFTYGTHDGHVYESDLRNPQRPLNCWNYSHSPVLSMLEIREPFNGVLVGRQDGTVNFLYENHQEIIHLTGSDCDPIYDLSYDEQNIYTACRDGKVRKYYLDFAFD